MERRRDRQQHRPAHALGRGDGDGPFDRAAVARDDDLPGAVVIGRLDHLAFVGLALRDRGGFGADLLGLRHVGAEQGGHRAFAGRDRLLHRLAAQLQQPGGVGDGEAAGGGQRGVFAERMSGDHDRLLSQREAALLLQHAQHGERVRHQGGLGVLGQGQFLAGAFEHQSGELLLQGFVDLLEHLARGGEGGGEVASHADGLAALPGKMKA